MSSSKIQESVRLPGEVVEIATEITNLLDSNASEAIELSDDLIQFDFAFAGRFDAKNFSVCYFPSVRRSGTPIEPTWTFLFSIEEIRLISEGKVREYLMWRCGSDCGVKSYTQDFYCGNCDF